LTRHYIGIVVVLGLLWAGGILIWATVARESKASQCDRLVKVVNEATTANPNTLGKTISEDNALLNQNAARLEGYARQLEGLHFDDLRVQELRDRFAQLYRNISRSMVDVTTAQQGNLQQVSRVNRALIEIQSQESPAVQALNQYCQNGH
jgi:uncharacterized membrane-anchored protein YhcB (DUF1043 family)